jgi:hypothetical protein
MAVSSKTPRGFGVILNMAYGKFADGADLILTPYDNDIIRDLDTAILYRDGVMKAITKNRVVVDDIVIQPDRAFWTDDSKITQQEFASYWEAMTGIPKDYPAAEQKFEYIQKQVNHELQFSLLKALCNMGKETIQMLKTGDVDIWKEASREDVVKFLKTKDKYINERMKDNILPRYYILL